MTKVKSIKEKKKIKKRKEIERLLKEIHGSSMRSVQLSSKLDELKSNIKQEETMGITKLTEQAFETHAQ